MSNLEKKNKHLTYDDRIEIQECLSKGFSFRAIGNESVKVQLLFPERLKLICNLIPTAS